MKKILAILGLMAVGAYSYGQGVVTIANGAAGFLIHTNTALSGYAGGNQNTNGTTDAVTGNGGNGYFYALLVQAYTGALTTNDPTANSWTFGVGGTNSTLTKGGISALGAAGGQPIPGWGAPTGTTYDTGAEDYFLLVGWSASLAAGLGGTSNAWNSVLGQLHSGAFVGPGSLGVSALGFGYGGGGPSALPVTSIFGVTGGMPGGLAAGFTLFQVPEPTTFALLGLGAAGLLIFRRRKE